MKRFVYLAIAILLGSCASKPHQPVVDSPEFGLIPESTNHFLGADSLMRSPASAVMRMEDSVLWDAPRNLVVIRVYNEHAQAKIIAVSKTQFLEILHEALFVAQEQNTSTLEKSLDEARKLMSHKLPEGALCSGMIDCSKKFLSAVKDVGSSMVDYPMSMDGLEQLKKDAQESPDRMVLANMLHLSQEKGLSQTQYYFPHTLAVIEQMAILRTSQEVVAAGFNLADNLGITGMLRFVNFYHQHYFAYWKQQSQSKDFVHPRQKPLANWSIPQENAHKILVQCPSSPFAQFCQIHLINE